MNIFFIIKVKIVYFLIDHIDFPNLCVCVWGGGLGGCITCRGSNVHEFVHCTFDTPT